MTKTRGIQFEVGPVRPPNEARSLLLRFTRNCPWNQCLFCPIYKGKSFSRRSVEEIKRDIQTARDIADDIRSLSWALGHGGEINDTVINTVLSDGRYGESHRQVGVWLYYGTGAVFLQDADNLIMKTDDLEECLLFLRQKFPDLTRVTTYSRSRTVLGKSEASMRRLRNAGLNRIHIGLETGYDPLLKLMKKGISQARHIEAGCRVVSAGMELSEYVMPGLGGRSMWKEHAVETARTLNAINPHFIRLRSLRVPNRIPLHALVRNGEFELPSDDEAAREIRVFLEHLEGITSTITSDHIMNLLEEVSGTFPQDKESMLDVVDEYLGLPDEERLIYRVGRRGGVYRSIRDLEEKPDTYAKIRNFVASGAENVETYLREMADQYI